MEKWCNLECIHVFQNLWGFLQCKIWAVLFSVSNGHSRSKPGLLGYPGTPMLSTPVMNVTSKSLIVNAAKVLRYLNYSKCTLMGQNDCGVECLNFLLFMCPDHKERNVLRCVNTGVQPQEPSASCKCCAWTGLPTLLDEITPLGASSGISTSVLELTHCCFLIITLIINFVFGYV